MFTNFFSDMGHAPEGLTLGRIDNNRGYAPENCRWETLEQQNSNRRTPTQALLDRVPELVEFKEAYKKMKRAYFTYRDGPQAAIHAEEAALILIRLARHWKARL